LLNLRYIILVRQEDRPRHLLRDGGGALETPVGTAIDEGELHRAHHADRIDAEMRAEAAILHSDHRVAHDGWDLVVGQPFAIARPHRHDHRAVGGVHADHLAVGRGFQLLEGRQLRALDIDGHDQGDQPQDNEHARDAQCQHQPATPDRGQE
jgi:hypothetical protein